MDIVLMSVVIMVIAFLMTMTGRGGGNFYMLTLVIMGVSMKVGAPVSQFVLMCSSLMAAVLFSKRKMNHWKLTIFLGILIFISAMAGGYFGGYFNDDILKIVFAVVMFVAACFMLKKPKERKPVDKPWMLNLTSEGETFQVNLFITIPIVFLAGFLSGMVGVSGGSFMVPLMILTMSVPMHIAVGTSTTLVAISAAAGFLGHLGAGAVDFSLALPLAVGGIIGGFFGAKMALKSRPKNLKYLFAGTQIVASVIMIINVLTH